MCVISAFSPLSVTCHFVAPSCYLFPLFSLYPQVSSPSCSELGLTWERSEDKRRRNIGVKVTVQLYGAVEPCPCLRVPFTWDSKQRRPQQSSDDVQTPRFMGKETEPWRSTYTASAQNWPSLGNTPGLSHPQPIGRKANPMLPAHPGPPFSPEHLCSRSAVETPSVPSVQS